MFNIKGFEWDNNNVWKPLRHGVGLEEVEEVFYNGPLVKKSRSGRYLALGQTDAGRYITVVFEIKAGSIIRPITARNMDYSEKRLYTKRKGLK
ncbi:Ribonuclease toxin, BrnT, of type II toxin-antitoxin system [Neomoorella glycerini]|uniref:Ribonuclease toxin, BrnT, of type II toxin-antitoxin system n=1 Tax=Neomoorella glycerini TaxID=55779 RepID=A0A6I5ZU26_9FIRM|nr:BrnT family toxin [Moorella glycerini]QGP93424.1 Ribonuclease toxin, BrnT, of type II toxin-antitoxin system [Moorella glycerini]